MVDLILLIKPVCLIKNNNNIFTNYINKILKEKTKPKPKKKKKKK